MKFLFDLDDGIIIVPARIHGPHGNKLLIRLALDTGATTTTINWESLILSGYDPGAIKDRIKMITGTGEEYVPSLELLKFESLGISKSNFKVLCHTMPASSTVDGVIGLNFLESSRLIIDFKERYLEII